MPRTREGKPEPAIPLSDLARKIRECHQELIASARMTLIRAIRCGELLYQAKQQVNHGDWLSWLEKHCTDISERTARNYMVLYENLDDLKLKSAEFADLGIYGALELIKGRTLDVSEETVAVQRKPRSRAIEHHNQPSSPDADIAEEPHRHSVPSETVDASPGIDSSLDAAPPALNGHVISSAIVQESSGHTIVDGQVAPVTDAETLTGPFPLTETFPTLDPWAKDLDRQAPVAKARHEIWRMLQWLKDNEAALLDWNAITEAAALPDKPERRVWIDGIDVYERLGDRLRRVTTKIFGAAAEQDLAKWGDARDATPPLQFEEAQPIKPEEDPDGWRRIGKFQQENLARIRGDKLNGDAANTGHDAGTHEP
jgi:hypothetical protein